MTRIYFCTIILFLGLTFIINEGFTQCLTCGGGAGSGYIGQTNSLGLTTNSFIAGRNATITGNNSAIIGSYSTNNGSSSYILGSNSIIDPGCLSSFALGVNCNIRNTMSLLLGYNLKTSTGNSMAIGLGKGIGNELLTTVQYSLIVGFNSTYPTFFVGPTPDGQNSGKIGIGNVINPLAKLHIKADIVEDASLLLEAPGSNKTAALVLSGTKNIISSPNREAPLAFLTGGENTRMVITGEMGKIGIGDFSAIEPEGKVHIKANDYEDATLIIESSATSKVSGLIFKNSSGNIATLDANQPINFYTGSTTLRMKIDGNGNVGIGTDTPERKFNVVGTSQFVGDIFVMGSNMYVGGEINAKKFRAVIDPLPDYVFSNDYNLLSLIELRDYISEHKHLPDIISSEEAATKGVELGEFNSLLLKKIEELTLYILAQEERIKELELNVNSYGK